MMKIILQNSASRVVQKRNSDAALMLRAVTELHPLVLMPNRVCARRLRFVCGERI